MKITRGLSSAGRAPALHAGGREFDPPRLHQNNKRSILSRKISELPKLPKLPEGGQTILPVVIISKGSYQANYKVSIDDIVKEITKQVDDGFSVEMEVTEQGITFKQRWPV